MKQAITFACLAASIALSFVLSLLSCGARTTEAASGSGGGGSTGETGGTTSSGGSSSTSQTCNIEIAKGCAQMDPCCPGLKEAAARCLADGNGNVPYLCRGDELPPPCAPADHGTDKPELYYCPWISGGILFCCSTGAP